MFDSLIAWLWKAVDAIQWFFLEIWKQVKTFLTSTWGVVLLASGWVWTALHYVANSLQSIVTAIEAIVFPTVTAGTGSLSNAFALCNTILPLQELFGLVIAYVTLIVALTIYRAIKSWIPTLS